VPVNSQDILEAMDGISLLIDRSLIVRQVGWRNWNSFWTKNGGAADTADVVGHDITDFFSEGEVRDTYRKLLLQLTERKRHLIQTDYRCDSPNLRRSMRLTVTPVQGSAEPEHLLYQSTILAVEQRPAIPLFDAPAVGSKWPDALKICSICAKVQWPVGSTAPDAEWIEPQEYYRCGGSEVVLLSHGFCLPCYEVFIAEEGISPA
jgi:hypothetical protein